MDPTLYDSDNSDEEKEKLNIFEGIQMTVTSTDVPDREPYVIVEHQNINVESTGKLDRTKAYASDKEVDAVVYNQDKAMETANCNKTDASTQYEYQTMSADLLQRTFLSQKFERFLTSIVPIMEEEVRQNVVLEKIMW